MEIRSMTTIQIWIDASIKTMKENISIMEEWFQKNEIDLVIEQSKVLQKHLISFIGYLEMKRKFG
jgi:hypothetical protein